MNKTRKIKIWGRVFELEIVYDCYTGEKVTKEQKQTYKWFCKHPEWIDKAKTYVKGYCKDAVNNDIENQKKDNVFSYIKPTKVYINRCENLVAIMCKYKYDLEHGLAIVFDHEGNITVSIQDIIL